MFGKARIAPMKALTNPMLELQASLLASRPRKVQRALISKIDKTFLWTDSTTVLHFIYSVETVENQPAFVANSVAEILELTTIDEWNYVQSCDNSADTALEDSQRQHSWTAHG